MQNTEGGRKWYKYSTHIWNFKINSLGCNIGILHEPTFLNSILSSWGIHRPAIVTCLSTFSQSIFLPLVLPLHMVWTQVSSNSVSVALLLARPQILFKELPASIHFPRLLAYNPPYPLDGFGLLKSESNVQTGTLDLGPFGVWIVKPTVVSRLKSKHYSSD